MIGDGSGITSNCERLYNHRSSNYHYYLNEFVSVTLILAMQHESSFLLLTVTAKCMLCFSPRLLTYALISHDSNHLIHGDTVRPKQLLFVLIRSTAELLPTGQNVKCATTTGLRSVLHDLLTLAK